jgi:hypothetical protein
MSMNGAGMEYRRSRKARLLCRNQEPVLMDLDSKHLTPATFLRHRHRNVSGIIGSADHVISRPQVLHCTLLRSRLTSLENCIANERKSLFGSPSSRSIRRRYEALGTNGISCRRFSYSSTISCIFAIIFHSTQLFRREEMLYKKCVALWVEQKNGGKGKQEYMQKSENLKNPKKRKVS